jgi:putative membrane protein
VPAGACPNFLTKFKTSRIAIGLLVVTGVVIFAGVLLQEGVMLVGEALVRIGWWVVPIVAFHAVPLLADVESWRVLFPRGRRPGFGRLFWSRWAGEAVTNLLPAAQVGGDLLRARLVALGGGSMTTSGATVIVDITIGVLTQIVFAIGGAVTLAAATGRIHLLGPVVALAGVATLLLAGFYAVQRIGVFRILNFIISRLMKSARWQAFARDGESMDRTVNALYAQTGGIAAGAAWSLFSWVAGAGEFWIALHALGLPADFSTALIMESVAQTVRGVLFVVPGALGFQEISFIGVGALLGLPPEISLALSLVKRVREILLGIPGLMIWQIIEGRRLFTRRSRSRT